MTLSTISKSSDAGKDGGATPNPLHAAAPANADAAEKADAPSAGDDGSVPDWAKPMPKETFLRDELPVCCCCCGCCCGDVCRVEAEGAPYVDTKERHLSYMREFAAAIYALASTVLTMYVAVMELVSKRISAATTHDTSVLEKCAWGYVMLYPLLLMVIINALCVEIMVRPRVWRPAGRCPHGARAAD